MSLAAPSLIPCEPPRSTTVALPRGRGGAGTRAPSPGSPETPQCASFEQGGHACAGRGRIPPPAAESTDRPGGIPAAWARPGLPGAGGRFRGGSRGAPSPRRRTSRHRYCSRRFPALSPPRVGRWPRCRCLSPPVPPPRAGGCGTRRAADPSVARGRARSLPPATAPKGPETSQPG